MNIPKSPDPNSREHPIIKNSIRADMPFWILTLQAFLVLGCWFVALSSSAQGTTFTYQGRLDDHGTPASGAYDLRVALYDSTNNPGVLVAGPLTNYSVGASNGLFAVPLDFGAGAFDGNPRWLEIAVRTNASGAFVTLLPRQKITATPYAITAGNVASGGIASGSYGNAVTFSNAANVFAGSFNGNGAGLTSVNASALNGLTTSNFWQLGGNSIPTPQLLGTLNNQSLDLIANSNRVLRLEPGSNDAPNIVGGSTVNWIAPGVRGAVIGGGGSPEFSGTNSIATGGNFSVIAGGQGNAIQGGTATATIGGGGYNIIDGPFSQTAITIAGGAGNKIFASGAATVGGGFANVIGNASAYSTISGGDGNTIQTNSGDSAIGGGFRNSVGPNSSYAVISGGVSNFVAGSASTVSGGFGNGISNAAEASISGGVLNRIAGASRDSAIVGGERNTISNAVSSVIIGGQGNYNSGGHYGFIGNGNGNQIGGTNRITGGGTSPGANNAIVGGAFNFIRNNSKSGVIGGGENNVINNSTNTIAWATVPGGFENEANATASFAAGFRAKANHDGAFVWSDFSSPADFTSTSSNQFLIRAQGGVGINTTAPASELDVNGVLTIYPGFFFAPSLTFSGDPDSGIYHPSANTFGLVTGGSERLRVASNGRVGIGTTSPATALHVREIGDAEIAVESTDAGAHRWTFQSTGVTGDPRDATLQIIDRTINAARLLIATNGNIGIGTSSPTDRLQVNGGITCTVLTQTSDRNAKENFADVSPREILEKIADLPIQTWDFKELPDGRHIGPMAQDFRAAFGLGPDDKHIAAVDADGVALAAIQGLNQKIESDRRESACKLQRLEAENADLKARLERLEQILNRNPEKQSEPSRQ